MSGDRGFMEYSKRRNLNRGYMKLETRQRAMDLFEMAFQLASSVSDFKLKSQFTDATQPISADIAEGYGRRSLPEYLQFFTLPKVLWPKGSPAVVVSGVFIS